MTFRADLHTHTTCSDGSLSPYELIDLARDYQLNAVSITDHDTVSAYTAEVMDYAKKRGVELLTGVEFSCIYEGIGVHLLGYNFNPTAYVIKRFCTEHIERRKERNLSILNLLKKEGIYISEEELYLGDSPLKGRVHIALLLVKKGYVNSISDAFKLYIGDHASCFERGRGFSIDDTIEIIHSAGGKAFLAHPHLMKEKKLIKKFLHLYEFDGVECFYANFPKQENDRWLKIAEKENLLVSGGSDFHGANKPYNKLGSAFVCEERFYKIKAKI